MNIGEISARLGMNIKNGHCPACDAKDSFQRGPEGGLAFNVRCARCGSKYNYLIIFGGQWIGHDEMPTKAQAGDTVHESPITP